MMYLFLTGKPNLPKAETLLNVQLPTNVYVVFYLLVISNFIYFNLVIFKSNKKEKVLAWKQTLNCKEVNTPHNPQDIHNNVTHNT